MHCPECGSQKSKVVHSRPEETGRFRERRCKGCGARFFTEEKVIL